MNQVVSLKLNTYEPALLQTSVMDVKDLFPYASERHAHNLDTDKIWLLEQLAKIDFAKDLVTLEDAFDAELVPFAFSLSPKMLESIVFILADENNPEIANNLCFILRKRFRPVLFHIAWNLIQELGAEDVSFSLWSMMTLLSELMLQREPNNVVATFVMDLMTAMSISGNESQESPDRNDAQHNNRKQNEVDFISFAIHYIAENQFTLRHFFWKYEILQDKPLGMKIQQEVFSSGSKTIFLRNLETLAGYLRRTPDDADVFSFYILSLDVSEYADTLNAGMVETWGYPDDALPFWHKTGIDCIQKIRFWVDLKILDKHFGVQTEKISFWSRYFNVISKVHSYANFGLLAIDCGDYVAVDVHDEDGYTYLYQKSFFEEELSRQLTGAGQWVEDTVIQKTTCSIAFWTIDKSDMVDAKAYYMKEQSAHIIQASYDRAKKLYFRAVLDKWLLES